MSEEIPKWFLVERKEGKIKFFTKLTSFKTIKEENVIDILQEGFGFDSEENAKIFCEKFLKNPSLEPFTPILVKREAVRVRLNKET